MTGVGTVINGILVREIIDRITTIIIIMVHTITETLAEIKILLRSEFKITLINHTVLLPTTDHHIEHHTWHQRQVQLLHQDHGPPEDHIIHMAQSEGHRHLHHVLDLHVQQDNQVSKCIRWLFQLTMVNLRIVPTGSILITHILLSLSRPHPTPTLFHAPDSLRLWIWKLNGLRSGLPLNLVLKTPLVSKYFCQKKNSFFLSNGPYGSTTIARHYSEQLLHA